MDSPDQPPPRRPLLRWIAVWLVLLAIPIVPFALLAALADADPFEGWARSVEGRPLVAGAVCSLMLVVDCFLPIPSSLVALVNGQAVGAVAGGILNWTAITLGHIVAFAAARRFGRPAALRFVGEQGLEQAGASWSRGATLGILLTRPLPVLAEAMSMFAGLTSISLPRYAAALAVGNLPHSFIYSWAGARLHDPNSLGVVLAAGIAVPAVGYLIYLAWGRWARRS